MIHGYNEYKVVWYNPLVGEDLLNKEILMTLTLCSLVWPDHFSPLLCGDGVILAPIQKKKVVRSGNMRLNNLAIKIIDGNLTLLGNILKEYPHIFNS